MSVRKIVQLAGDLAQFALADDGTVWLWTPGGWVTAGRGPLPQPPPTPEEKAWEVTKYHNDAARLTLNPPKKGKKS